MNDLYAGTAAVLIAVLTGCDGTSSAPPIDADASPSVSHPVGADADAGDVPSLDARASLGPSDDDPCVPRDALPDPFLFLFDDESEEIITSGAVDVSDIADVCGFVRAHRVIGFPEVRWWAGADLAPFHGRIREACALWRPLGVRCVQVKDIALADAVFIADGVECTHVRPVERGGTGGCLLGYAHADGVTELCLAQMAKDRVDGDPYDEFVAVTAHEIGHQLGVAHVPDDCADVTMTPMHGYIACGPALMNPFGTDIDALTFADLVAFAARNRERAVFPRVPCGIP